MRIAYLTSLYARATDTFIRDEVAQLRVMGEEVHTFSIRRPAPDERVSTDVREEQERTLYLLDQPRSAFVLAVLANLLLRPRRFREAVAVARQLSRPGLKARLWPWFYLAEASLLAKHLRRRKLEHLHNHIGEGSAAVAMLASILTGTPYSITIHGPSEWDRPHELSLDLKTRYAKFVAVISEYTRGQLLRWIDPEDWDKVHIVRCGIRLEDYVPLTDEERATKTGTTFVSIGRLAPEKGHLVLLQALNLMKERPEDLRVVIVGDGPERDRLETYASEHQLTDTVEFVGWKTSEEVREILRWADCLVMPSFAEGLPISIMEALAVDVPVISSEVGAVLELIAQSTESNSTPVGARTALAQTLTAFVRAAHSGRPLVTAAQREALLSHDIVTQTMLLRQAFNFTVESPC